MLHSRVKSMEQVTEYFPGKPNRTRVWMTEKARDEMEIVHEDLAVIFEARAESGMPNANTLHNEGDGVWAIGTRRWTIRITGYFLNPITREDFICCGVYEGKTKRGNKRPKSGDNIVERTIRIRNEGVLFVQETPSVEREGGGAQGPQRQTLLRTPPPRRPVATAIRRPESGQDEPETAR